MDKFEGLNLKKISNKYYTCDRVNADGTRIVVRVATGQLFRTRYGYGMILDRSHVVWLKDWQVSISYDKDGLGDYFCEVIINKDYFNVKQWGEFNDYSDDAANLDWQAWLDAAKDQQAHGTSVAWRVGLIRGVIEMAGYYED